MADKPKILVTNDDGIYSPGIYALCQAMKEIGDVYVVAPDSEKSGVSHAITFTEPLRVIEVKRKGAFFGWAVSGTPTDCVKIAISKVLPFQPDLIVSGINRGSNAAINVIYSGTVAAAIEGAIVGIPSIAFSLTSFTVEDYRLSADAATILARQVLANGLPADVLLSVNIPPLTKSEVKGFKITRMGEGRYKEDFDERVDPAKRTYYWLTGKRLFLDTDENTDDKAVKDGYISVTPLQLDLTCREMIPKLQEWDISLEK